MGDKSAPGTGAVHRKRLFIAVVLALVCVGLIALTDELSRRGDIALFVTQRGRLIAAEIALFGIVIVELLGSIWLTRFRERNALQMGMTLRVVFRVVVYSIMAIAIVSILSDSPALAVGVGPVIGIIVGFSPQNLFGGIIAGTLVAIVRPIKVGDEITVMGNTGRVE